MKSTTAHYCRYLDCLDVVVTQIREDALSRIVKDDVLEYFQKVVPSRLFSPLFSW